MKKKFLLLFCLGVWLLVGCQKQIDFKEIDAKTAKTMMDESEENLIIDVRSKQEYQQGHIAHAILLPVETIETDIKTKVPNKEATLLIYCRSGRRAKTAASKLIELGYQNVYVFGGIDSWSYGVVK